MKHDFYVSLPVIFRALPSILTGLTSFIGGILLASHKQQRMFAAVGTRETGFGHLMAGEKLAHMNSTTSHCGLSED